MRDRGLRPRSLRGQTGLGDQIKGTMSVAGCWALECVVARLMFSLSRPPETPDRARGSGQYRRRAECAG